MVPSKSFRIAIIFIIMACILNAGCSAYSGQSVQKNSISAQPQAFSGAVSTSNNSLVFINGLIYQQPINPNGGLLPSSWWDPVGSDSDQYVWDDFTLASSQSITNIQWYGGYNPTILFGAGAALNFSVKIYASIAGGSQPDVNNPPLVSYLTNNNAGETLYGMVGGINVYSYSFTLPAAFNAIGGTKYWLQVEAYENGTPDWGLALGTGGDGKHFKRTVSLLGDPIKYSVGSGDAAFALLGPVPAMPPTDILLTNTTVDENQPVDTIVGALTATDPDPNATFAFSLTCAVPAVDDISFNINGTDLQTSASFDFETKSAYNICVRVTDQNNLSFDKNFIVNVNDVNEPPTDIALSNITVDENQPVNTVVGVLSATDPDAGATFTFDLTCAIPGVDDGSFNIFGTDLRTSAVFDFATKPTYGICIQVMDQGGLTFDKNFTIAINKVNVIPTDTPTNTPTDTPTATPTNTSTNTPTFTPTNTPTDTPTPTPTLTDTPTNTPTDTPTWTPTNTPTDTPTPTPTFTDTPTNTPTDTPTFTPTATDTPTYTPTPTDTPTSVPTNTPTPTPIVNTPGKVTGGGSIGSNKGGLKATFGFTINFSAGDGKPKGNLTYQDHQNNWRMKATAFDLLVIDGDHAWFTGIGLLDNGQVVPFTVEVDALSKSGQADTFYIYLPALNDYKAGGALSGGNVTIH